MSARSDASWVVLIPALNESSTVGAVVRAAVAAGLGSVCVIDDGSSDDTALQAAAAGAKVIRLERNLGKAGAVHAAALTRHERWTLLLDADLVGLTPEHVQALAQPVLDGAADMTRGVFTGGRWRTTWAQKLLPMLNGQRALPREALLAMHGLSQRGYGLEVEIERYARSHAWRNRDVSLQHVTQRMKEEKHGFWVGSRLRWRMYGQVWRALWLHRPPERRATRAPHGQGANR
jgi:glycosyltransferase involved in cell wall biosynthesis